MLRTTVVCFLASYAVAFGLDVTRLLGWKILGRWGSTALGLAGLIAQTMYLLTRAQESSLPPLLSSMHDWLLVLSWLIVLIHLFVSLMDRDLAIGIVIWPLVIGLVAAANFVPRQSIVGVNVHYNWAMLHVVLLVFGIACVFAGFAVSLLYLWQHSRLKRGRSITAGWTLPSLERLERINRWALLMAVPLLTFGMLIGVGLTLLREPDVLGELTWTDPVVLVSAVCWLMMAGLFTWVVCSQRPPGRQMAWLTVWSAGFLLLTTVGSQMLTKAVRVHSLHGSPSRAAAPEPGSTEAPR